MGIVFTLISALLPFALTELQSFKVVSPNISALITGVEGAAAAFIAELTNRPADGTVSVTATAILASISAAVAVLKAQTNISPQALSITIALDSAIQAGLAASAVTTVVPGNLQPIAPLV